jgi:hypothetical protein
MCNHTVITAASSAVHHLVCSFVLAPFGPEAGASLCIIVATLAGGLEALGLEVIVERSYDRWRDV